MPKRRRDHEFEDDDNPNRPLTDTEQAIVDSINAAFHAQVDVAKAMNHRFEYHIFHAGESFRIGRASHHDFYDLIGEWVGKRIRQAGGHEVLMKPVHVFLDGKLSTVLVLQGIGRGSATFQETSVFAGLVHEAEILDDLRILTWNPDEKDEENSNDGR